MIPRHLPLLLLLLTALPAASAIPTSAAGKTSLADIVRAQLQALENDDAEAMAALGWRYVHGDGVAQDEVQALKWFRAAADKGSLSGMYGLSDCLRYGRGVAPDVAAADKLLLAAAEGGHAPAQATAGGLASDAGRMEQSRAWYEKAAAQGNAAGQRGFGWLLLHGKGGPADSARGLALLRAAADAGETRAMNALADAYRRGIGVEPDAVQAREWFRRSAAAGNARGRVFFGMGLYHGTGGARDADEALRLFRLAADDGEVDALYALALAYDDAGPRHDAAESARWRQRAIEQGDIRAMEWQGRLLYEGDGMPIDPRGAARLFAQAADKGSLDAAFYLALCLEEGRGIAKDTARAAQLFKAAAAIHPEAQRSLIAMHFAGRGMVRDTAAANALIDADLGAGKHADMLRLAALLLDENLVDDAGAVIRRVQGHPGVAAARAQSEYIDAFGLLGPAYRAVGRLEEAQVFLEQGLTLLEAQPEADPGATADALANLGGVLLLRGQPERASAVFTRSIALRGAASGKALAKQYLAIASNYHSADRFAEAHDYREKALALMRQAKDVPAADLARALTDLGTILHSRGNYEQARSVLEQAVAAIDSHIDQLSLKLAAPLQMLGSVQLALGRPDLAEAAWRRRLALCETDSGDSADLRRGSAVSDLALLTARAGQHAQAERMLLEALDLRKNADHKPSIGTATALQRLANVYRDSARPLEANATYERALALMAQIPASAGWDRARVLHDYGLALRQQDQAERATALLEQAFALRVAVQPVHHLTRQSADALAALYRAGGKDAAAVQVEERMRTEALRAVQVSAP